jgi:hypothetical protein
MGHSAGSGDRLARGAVKASYLTTEKTITDKKWNDIFDGFDPEAFKNSDSQKSVSGEKEKTTRKR